MIGTAKIIGRQLYLQIELIRAGNVPAYFLSGSCARGWLIVAQS